MLLGDVFGLRVAERPNLIRLDGLARQVAQHLVLVGRAGRSEVYEQLRDRVLGRSGDPRGFP